MEINRKRKLVLEVINHANIQPFHRSSSDKMIIFKYLQSNRTLKAMPKTLLLKLAEASVTESYNETNEAVLAINGLFIVLQGSVEIINGQSRDQEEKTVLCVGDCFGDLETNEVNQENNSDQLVVLTKEPCIFLKLSSLSFQRITKNLKDSKMNERLSLLQQCQFFSGWPIKSIKEFAAALVWRTYPPGTVMLQEDDTSPMMFVIKDGCCVKLKKLLVTEHGTSVKARHFVPLGNLTLCDYFGEQSHGSPLSYKVDSSGPLSVACIAKASIKDMAETTRDLYRQTGDIITETFCKDEIQRIYVEKQFKDNWKATKAQVLQDVLETCGICPGYSKWGRNFKPEEESL